MENTLTILPVSEVRAQFSELTDQVKESSYIIITKGGKPRAALVDFAYLQHLETEAGKIARMSYFSTDHDPFIRQYSDKEIAEWEFADQLP